LGVMITLALVLIYAAANFGVFRFYRGEKKHEFRIWPHFFCPAISSLALLGVAVGSVYPAPAAPVRYGPALVAGWFAVGVFVLLFYNRTGERRGF
jgi:amino acid transporter